MELQAALGRGGSLGGRAIFDAVSLQLPQHGQIPRGGQIVDASIVQAPITQTNKDEREALNEGRKAEGWSANRMRHTDSDARWTKKQGKSFYGYKVHANADARYKLLRKAKITAANVDDDQTLKDVLECGNTGARVLADRGHDAQAKCELLQAAKLRDGIARRAQAGPRQASTAAEAQQGDQPHPSPGRACVCWAGAAWRQVRAGANAGPQRAGHPAPVRGLQHQAAGLAGQP